MHRVLMIIVCALAAIACEPIETATTAGGGGAMTTGGNGGEATTAGSSGGGGTGGMTAMGGTGGAPCRDSLSNVGEAIDVDYVTAAGLTGVHVVEPLESEDGSWVRVVFGPFCEPHTITGFRFAARGAPVNAIPIPWKAGLAEVGLGLDPAAASCAPTAEATPSNTVSFEQAGADVVLLDWQTAPFTLSPGGVVLACIRNYVDVGGEEPNSAVLTPMALDGSDRDQWEDANGTVHVMADYGTSFDHPWMVELLEEP